MRKLLFTVAGAVLLLACSHHEKLEQHDQDENVNASGEDIQETESVTLYSENLEVFTEFKSLYVDHESNFLIHITQLNDDYSAYTGEPVKIVLKVEEQEQIKVAETTEVDGIYSLTLVPEIAGMGSLSFDIQVNSKNENLTANHIQVYSEDEEVVETHETMTGGLIRFNKEQAWNSRFNVIQVKADSFAHVITTSGEFMAMPGEKQNVIAKSQGIVLFAIRNLVQGKYVNKGDELFTLSGQGLADNNIMVRFNEAKTSFLVSKNNFKRNQTLINENIISEKAYLESESKYITDSILYYSLKETVSSEGMKIHAPMSGYLHELNVSEGQFMEPGNLMGTISTNKVMLLRADVPQQYFNMLGNITTTHFRPAYTQRVYTLKELSGKLIARGASVAENNHYMPVYFEVVNDGTLLEGAFAEFYLKTNPEPGHLVIPVTALIEEQNNFYVYVQVSGEEYLKRFIRLVATDGKNASVASGLSIGERIVSEGAMLIKTATSSGIPAHNHQH